MGRLLILLLASCIFSFFCIVSGVWAQTGFATNAEEIEAMLLKAEPNKSGDAMQVTVAQRRGDEHVLQIILASPGEGALLKIEFAPGSRQIVEKSSRLLAELGQVMNSPSLAGKHFYVRGHTDSDGSAEMNLELSLARAESVCSYLENESGVDRNRLTVLGFGENLPIADNKTALGKQNNRRVEIVCFDPPQADIYDENNDGSGVVPGIEEKLW